MTSRPGCSGELAEQVELDRRQVDLLAVTPHGAVGEVDLQVADPDGRVAVLAPSPQHRAHPGEQLLAAEGLGDVVVGAGVERPDLLALVADRGEDHDRDLAPAPDVGRDLDPVAVRQHEVEDDRVWRPDRDGVERLLLGGRLLDAVAGVARGSP